jgi:hypothetical protein
MRLLVLLIIAPTVAFAQGSVTLQNQTGLVMQSSGVPVPKGGGYVQLIAAPKSTSLPNPLLTQGALNFSSLSGFLAANPGWAPGVVYPGFSAVPTQIAFGPGLFSGGTYWIINIGEAADADYFLLAWTGTSTNVDAAIAAYGLGQVEFGESAVFTTETGSPISSNPWPPVSLRKTFAGMTLYPAPEPATGTLLALGGMIVWWLGRRSRVTH